jgi:hypothetical protein
MVEILTIPNETQISSSHVINIAGNHTGPCCICGNVLSFVDIVPNTVVLWWNDRVAQCEGLSEDRESACFDGA